MLYQGFQDTVRIDTLSLVTVGRSFLDIVDHSCTIDQLHHEAHRGSDKWDCFKASYSRTRYTSKGQFGRFRPRLHQGQYSHPFQSSLRASKGSCQLQDTFRQGGPPYVIRQRPKEIRITLGEVNFSQLDNQGYKVSETGIIEIVVGIMVIELLQGAMIVGSQITILKFPPAERNVLSFPSSKPHH